MKVEIISNGLWILPETEFEKEYIGEFQCKELKAFVKTGSSLKDIIGIKIIENK